MAKLGSTKRPLVLRLHSEEAAAAAIALCEEHGWRAVVGVEPGEPEDLRDLERALRRAGDQDRSGVMVPFVERFRDLAQEETRSVTVGPGHAELPEDDYVFVERYCVDPACDCRRVLISVLAVRQGAQVATLNHAFDPPSADDHLDEDQTFLDPLNPQSHLAPALLELFEEVCLTGEYRRRLERHYDLMKGAGAARRIVAPSSPRAQRTMAPLRRSAPALTPEERARQANRRKRERRKARRR
jgi:hypothetical protein